MLQANAHRLPPISVEQQRKICTALAAGRLHAEAGKNGLPTIERIHKALEHDDNFIAAFEAARVAWAENVFESLPAIADAPAIFEETSETNVRDVDGNLVSSSHRIHRRDNVERSRLRVATRQWMLKYIYPAKFGELNNATTEQQPPQIVENMTPDLPLADDDAAALQALPPPRRA